MACVYTQTFEINAVAFTQTDEQSDWIHVRTDSQTTQLQFFTQCLILAAGAYTTVTVTTIAHFHGICRPF